VTTFDGVADDRPGVPVSLAVTEPVRVQVEPMYGCGWSYRSGKHVAVLPPFSIEVLSTKQTVSKRQQAVSISLRIFGTHGETTSPCRKQDPCVGGCSLVL
jgi:hypothetical protein